MRKSPAAQRVSISSLTTQSQPSSSRGATGPPPPRFPCTFQGCGKSFARQSNLKAHWRIHSGEQPYRCSACHRTFKWRSSLKYHVSTCEDNATISKVSGAVAKRPRS